MLFPDNIQPELSIYYNGFLVLDELLKDNQQEFLTLYQSVKKKSNMSFPTYVLSLDWLYLIDAAKLNEKGDVELCI